MDYNPNSLLTAKILEIKKFAPNWYIFSQNGTLTEEEVNELLLFDNLDSNEKIETLKNQDQTICEILIKLLNRVTIERILQYILQMIDTLILNDITSTRIFIDQVKRIDFDIYEIFIKLLNKEEIVTNELTCKLLYKVITFGYNDFKESTLLIYCNWLKNRIDSENNDYLIDDLICCQYILRISSVRYIFYQIELLKSLIYLLVKTSNFQIQYQIIFCLWLIAYEKNMVPILIEYKLPTKFNEILKNAQKNKVIRIILLTCHNMIQNSDNSSKILSLFVYNKFIPILQSFQKRVFNDEDLENNLNEFVNLLLATVQDLSTYDEYSGELLNGKLEWTPVHKSDKFWRENAQRLCENNNQLLLVLINTIKSSNDPVSISVACHDIGEFVRYYSRGKNIIQTLGAIEAIIPMLQHHNQNIKYHSLISLQKIMVLNWDFLGRQLSSFDPSPKQETA